MRNVPVLHLPLEDTAHHLGSSVSSYVLMNVPGGAEIPHEGDQVLAVKLARWGGYNCIPPCETVCNHQEIMAV